MKWCSYSRRVRRVRVPLLLSAKTERFHDFHASELLIRATSRIALLGYVYIGHQPFERFVVRILLEDKVSSIRSIENTIDAIRFICSLGRPAGQTPKKLFPHLENVSAKERLSSLAKSVPDALSA
jgi:hypothetical protein